ncbi:hypothetical protein SprV_0301319300 [Sparganum proliferum]
MGSPISGYLAEAVLQELETRVFQTYKPKFWMRYVDDTFVILHRDAKDNFKRELDSVYPQIQFTMEEETNGVLSFLDVQVSRQEDGTLQTGVFRKATDTEKILHYNSNHPLSHKRSCVRTLFHRINTHCSTEAEKLRERKTLWHLFLANGYPRSFVNKCLYRRHTKTDGEEKQRPEIFRVLPYVRNVSEATERMLRPLSVGVGHRPEATIRRLIMQPKDRLPPADTSGVIYRVKCLDCPANYCGMTDKRLRTRMHEHTLAVRRKDVRSHVAMHCLENNHTFDFDGAQVLGRAESKLAREVIEAWKSDTNSINRNNPRSKWSEQRTALVTRKLVRCKVVITALSGIRFSSEQVNWRRWVPATPSPGAVAIGQSDKMRASCLPSGTTAHLGRLPCLPQDINECLMSVGL